MGLVGLIDVYWRESERRISSICNFHVYETVLHFVGECPIYKYTRKSISGKEILSTQEVIDILNGLSRLNFYMYLKNAQTYKDRNHFLDFLKRVDYTWFQVPYDV